MFFLASSFVFLVAALPVFPVFCEKKYGKSKKMLAYV
jgi:hypothetical protein